MGTHAAEWADFAAGLESSNPLAATLDDSVDALPLADAIALSLKSRKPGRMHNYLLLSYT